MLPCKSWKYGRYFCTRFPMWRYASSHGALNAEMVLVASSVRFCLGAFILFSQQSQSGFFVHFVWVCVVVSDDGSDIVVSSDILLYHPVQYGFTVPHFLLDYVKGNACSFSESPD